MHHNDSPAKSIGDEMTTLFHPKTPSDVPCNGLTSTDNVFGRLLNGQTVAEVCTMHATTARVTGQFVHIEQTTNMLLPSNDLNFAEAVKISIDTSCRPQKHKDSFTLVCVSGEALSRTITISDNALSRCASQSRSLIK